MRSWAPLKPKYVERLLLALRHRRIDRQLVAADVGADEERDADGFSPVRRPRERIRRPSGFLREFAVAFEPGDVLGRLQVRGRNDDDAVRLGLDVKRLDEFDARRLGLCPGLVAFLMVVGTESPRTTSELQLRPEPRGLLVIRMAHRQVQRRPRVLIHGRRQIAPRSHVTGLQHLVGRRGESRLDAAAADRVVFVPRRAIMVGEHVQVDRPVVARADRHADQRLRPVGDMIRHQLVIGRQQQAVHVPHVSDAVLLFVLGQRQGDLARRQVGVERLPGVFPIGDPRNQFAIEHLRRDLLAARRKPPVQRDHATRRPAGIAPRLDTGRPRRARTVFVATASPGPSAPHSVLVRDARCV